MLLTHINGFIFDTYGVLFDTAKPTTDACEKRFPGMGHKIAKSWFKRSLKFSWLASLTNQDADLWEVIIRALESTLKKFNRQYSDADLQELGKSMLDLELFADAIPVLKKLKEHGKTSIILSDASLLMLQRLLKKGDLSNWLCKEHPAVSAQEMNFFKPHQSTYAAAAAALGMDRSQIAFVTGSPWDAAGARAAGFEHVFLLWRHPSHVQSDFFGKALEATYRVESMHQMLEMLMMPDLCAKALLSEPSSSRGKYAPIQVESSYMQPHQHTSI